ncbi:MAG: ferric reductase-like transmembrane domain-containing protein [Myxococcota bacterium]
MGTAVVGSFSALSPLASGVDATSATDAVHFTARVSFAFFMLVYVARPLARSSRVRVLLRWRRDLGLAVALCLTAHLAALALLFTNGSESPTDDPVRFIFGAEAFVALYAMALTSSNRAKRILRLWWKRLHRVALHSLWLFFLASYVLEAARDPVFAPAVLLLVGGAVWRSVLFLRRKMAPRERGSE